MCISAAGDRISFKTMEVIFKPYGNSDYQSCIEIFDANCPEYFAPNERQDYREFLADRPAAYEVCKADGVVVGAFGLLDDDAGAKQLNWILLNPQAQGIGIGKKIMERVIQLGQESSVSQVNIAASQKSAPFFARFGATPTTTTVEGWGPGLDRVNMVLVL